MWGEAWRAWEEEEEEDDADNNDKADADEEDDDDEEEEVTGGDSCRTVLQLSSAPHWQRWKISRC